MTPRYGRPSSAGTAGATPRGCGLGQARSVAVSPDGSAVFVTGLAQDPLTQPSFYTTIAYSP